MNLSRTINPRHWHPLLRFGAASVTAVAIAGCSSSTPSASDAEDQIKAVFKDCENIQVSNFEKLNGVAQSDGSHDVSTRFTLTATPLPENLDLLKQVEARHRELEPLYQEYVDTLNAMRAEIEELQRVADEFPYESPEHKERTRIWIQKSRESDQFENKNLGLKVEYIHYNPTPKGNLERLNRNFVAKCHFPRTRLTTSLVHQLISDPEAFVQPTEAEFTATFNMVKSDNGWVVHNLWQ